eukprot:COSAG01_NODE_494_length_16322_cov_35.380879_8_plen_83_part_00
MVCAKLFDLLCVCAELFDLVCAELFDLLCVCVSIHRCVGLSVRLVLSAAAAAKGSFTLAVRSLTQPTIVDSFDHHDKNRSSG